jgi:hypothetical protein
MSQASDKDVMATSVINYKALMKGHNTKALLGYT